MQVKVWAVVFDGLLTSFVVAVVVVDVVVVDDDDVVDVDDDVDDDDDDGDDDDISQGLVVAMSKIIKHPLSHASLSP